MNFAINYSEVAESLVERGQIQVDLFKCPDWPWLIKQASRIRPVMVHYDLQIGNQNLSHTDWREVNGLFEATLTKFINFHLEPQKKQHPDIPHDSIDPDHQEVISKRIQQELQSIIKRYPEDKIILENAIYRNSGGKVIKPGVLPGVFERIFNQINCGLLLDISHARISARSLGIDEREYISNLPVKRIKEIHFTGLHNINGKYVDHLPILEEDWPILEWVLSEIKSGNFATPWLFVYEYGGVGEKYADRCDQKSIEDHVPRLYQLVHSI